MDSNLEQISKHIGGAEETLWRGGLRSDWSCIWVEKPALSECFSLVRGEHARLSPRPAAQRKPALSPPGGKADWRRCEEGGAGGAPQAQGQQGVAAMPTVGARRRRACGAGLDTVYQCHGLRYMCPTLPAGPGPLLSPRRSPRTLSHVGACARARVPSALLACPPAATSLGAAADWLSRRLPSILARHAHGGGMEGLLLEQALGKG